VNAPSPQSWTSALTKALVTLAIAAVVLFVIEKVFVAALPAVLVILALIGVYRIALGMFRRDGW